MAKSIGEYKKDYEAARARGDAAGMQAANDGANAVRASLGLTAQSASDDISKFQSSSTAKTPTTTSGTSSGSTLFSGGSSGMSSSEILALGKGPLSSGAAANYVATGSTTPAKASTALQSGASQKTQTQVQQPQQQVSVTDSPEYQALMAQLNQVQSQLTQRENDYSDYVKRLNEAAKAKSLAELEAAYKKNVNAIDAAKGQIAPQYTDARNQVAGQAAVSRKNWQETASALGINSGAAGQSAIAQNIAMQNNLAALDKSETADMAALDLQRTQATTDYNSAIAQAEASGDYELAAALYQEKVRADEAARADQSAQFQQLLARLQFEHGVSQDALAQENQERNFRFQTQQAETTQQNQEFNKLLTLASSFAESTGDYSLFSQFGFTPEQIKAWNSAWASQHALELQQAYAKLASGSKTTSGSGKTAGESAMTLSTAKELAKNGLFYNDVLDVLRKGGYTDEAIKTVYGWQGVDSNDVGVRGMAQPGLDWENRDSYGGTAKSVETEAQTLARHSHLGDAARRIANRIDTMYYYRGLNWENRDDYNVPSQGQIEEYAKQIETALRSGDITEVEADYLLGLMGY